MFRKMTNWIAILAMFALAAPARGELTYVEKAEVAKLHRASALIGTAFEPTRKYGVGVYAWATARSGIGTATSLLVHAHTDRLKRNPVEYPDVPGEPIPRRDEVVAAALGMLDAILPTIESRILRPSESVLAACSDEFDEPCVDEMTEIVADLRHAVALLESFDRSLGYADPLLPNFPRQFGIHGDYPLAQTFIGESKRLLGYSIARFAFVPSLDDPVADVAAREVYARCTMAAYDRISRIKLLSAGIAVHPADEHLDQVERAFGALRLALSFRHLPGMFTCASSGLSSFAPVANTASRDLLGAWKWSDSWADFFLQVK